MSAAGERVRKLWVEANRATVEAAWAEAVGLADQLEENERDYLEGLASVRAVLTGRQPDAPPVP